MLKDAEIKLLLGLRAPRFQRIAIVHYLVYYMSYEQLCEYVFELIKGDNVTVFETTKKYLIPLPWHVLLSNKYKFCATERMIWNCCVNGMEDYRCLEQMFPQCKDSILLRPVDFEKLYGTILGGFLWISKEVYMMYNRSGYAPGMEYLIDWHKCSNIKQIIAICRSTQFTELKDTVLASNKPPLRIWGSCQKIAAKYRGSLFVTLQSKIKAPIEVKPAEFIKIMKNL